MKPRSSSASGLERPHKQILKFGQALLAMQRCDDLNEKR